MNFDQLYLNVERTLRGISYKMARPFCSNNHLLEAEDLYQEMVSYLWENFKGGVPAHINRSYIVRGCKYHILNYLRKKKNKAFMVSIDQPVNDRGNTLSELIFAPDKDARKDIDAQITVSQILGNGLTAREKQVFSFLLEGFTLREIGKKLGVSHVRVLNIRKNIREKCESEI